MHGPVSRETEALNRFAELLLKWNKSCALVSRKSTIATLNRLLQNTREAARLLPQKLARLYDIGSGNGIPGIVFAILYPELQVHLVERSRKKCLFLEAAAHHLALDKVEIHNTDFAAVEYQGGGPTAITSIGLDLYDDIAARLRPHLQPGDGLFLFVNQQFAENLAAHVSCGTYWWKPLSHTNISGVCWLEV